MSITLAHRVPTATMVILLLAASTAAAQVTLAWDPPPDTDVAGYRIHAGRVGGVYDTRIDVGNTTSFAFTGLQPGFYLFAVTAYSSTGAESVPSAEISATVPEPVVSVRLTPRDTSLVLNDSNYSAHESLMTYTWPERRVANAILMTFDLSPIPAGAAIAQAELQLSLVDNDAADATYAVSAHRIVGANPMPERATGYTSDGVAPWTPSSAAYNNVPLAQANISAAYDWQPLDRTPGIKSWNLTSLVEGWLADPSANVGLLLNSDTTAPADRYRYFASMEDPDVARRPGLIVTYVSSPEAVGGYLELTPEDTSLNVNASNYSSNGRLMAYTWPAQRVANAALMRFDVSAIPPDATIQDATLQLALVESDASADSLYRVSVHKVVGANPVIARATGYTADGTTRWTATSCCYNGVPMAQANISAPYDISAIDQVPGPKRWTITSLVQDWVTDPAGNAGLLLNADPAAGADRYRYFASMEHAEASLRPVLRIRYTVPR